ncbi:MAG: VOC family protein [Acetobacteraceae bacterium]
MPDRFIWYELMTPDPVAAARFYGRVMGWTATDSGLADRSYTIVSAGETPVGGMMAMPASAARPGARPGWLGYIGVRDVDAAASRVTAAGGTIHRPAEDIPEVGRFAVVADPQGAPFVLFKGSADAGPARPQAGTPGFTGWHELHSKDWESAFAFYSGLFGWTKAEAHDIGAMGIYQLFTIDGVAAGGMMNHKDVSPHPFWLFYFNVADINEAAARVTSNDGRILSGPHEVPGGDVIVHCADAQGAMFAMVAPGR